jgi:hypothetical protein
MGSESIMTELILEGILQIDGADEEGILLSFDWDKLYEYNPEIYLYLKTAELNGQMIQ